MKILAFWDIYGRVWRKALAKEIDSLKEKYEPDFCIANLENCTSGRGPVEKHVKELEALWIDFFSGGDHIFDNLKSIENYLTSAESKILRPANLYEQKYYSIPGKWYSIIEKNWKKLLFIHLIWEVFMNHNVYSPFLKADEILEELDKNWVEYDASIIDFHCEASAEFYGLAHFLDGRVSAMFGTHTHVQTNDEKVLQGKTAIISDIGMNGPLYGVIGADYGSVRKRFLSGISKWLISQSLEKDYLISGAIFEIGDDGKANWIEKIRIEGTL